MAEENGWGRSPSRADNIMIVVVLVACVAIGADFTPNTCVLRLRLICAVRCVAGWERRLKRRALTFWPDTRAVR